MAGQGLASFTVALPANLPTNAVLEVRLSSDADASAAIDASKALLNTILETDTLNNTNINNEFGESKMLQTSKRCLIPTMISRPSCAYMTLMDQFNIGNSCHIILRQRWLDDCSGYEYTE